MEVVVCSSFDAEPSPELILMYCQFNPLEENLVSFKQDEKINLSSKFIRRYGL